MKANKEFAKELVVGCTDYTRLNIIKFNRNFGYRKNLHESMNMYGFIDEIKVVRTSIFGKKDGLYILDGQNRFETARKTEKPFDYIIEAESDDRDTIAKMIIIYNSKREDWSMSNYINLYATIGVKDYQILKALCEEFSHIRPRVMVNLLRGVVNRSTFIKYVKEGEFRITAKEFAKKVAEETYYFSDIAKPTAKFVTAFSRFYLRKKDEYYRPTMLRALENTKVEEFHKINDDMIEGILSSKYSYYAKRA